MSVLTKLMQARLKLQNAKLNKTGHNKFAGYYYFELGDFLPTVQQIFAEIGLCGVVSYTADTARLTITDVESATQVEITSPMGSAALKGCHEVQNIGAVETYQRRYLWVTAMEIVEHDALDATTGSEKAEKPAKPVASISPNDVGKDFWNRAATEGGEEINYLVGLRDSIRGLLKREQGEAAATEFYAIKDIEEASAVWSQFDSKERGAIKSFKPVKAAA